MHLCASRAARVIEHFILEKSPMADPQGRRPIFGNSAVVFVFVFAAIAVAAYAQFAVLKAKAGPGSSININYAIPAMAGAAVAALVVPLFLGWIGYLLGARSTKVARATACAVAVLVAGVHGMKIHRETTAHRSNVVLDKELVVVKKEQAEAIRSGDTDRLAVSGERTVKALEDSVKGGTNEDQRAMAIIANFSRELNEMAILQNKAFEKFGSMGGLSLESIKTTKELDARIAQLALIQDHVKKSQNALGACEKELERRLTAGGVRESIISEVMRGFKSASEIRAKQTELNVSNAEYCTAAKTMLGVLKTQWGKWKFDESGIVYDRRFPEAAAESLSAANDRVIEISLEQDKMTSELLKLLSKGTKQATAERP